MKKLANKLRANTFFRFSIIGGFGLATNLFIFYIFTYFLLLNVNISALAAFVVAVSQNYILNHFWTFKNYANGRPNLKNYTKYVGVNILGLSVNLIVLNVLHYYKEIEALGAQFLGIAAGLLTNYSGSYFFVFAANSNLSALVKKRLLFFINGKKILITFLLSSLFIFSVIWVGEIISVITSREILEPLVIKIEGLDKKNLDSVKVLSTLSRAGNTVSLARVGGKENGWDNPCQTFIKKILIGFKKEQLDKFSYVAVSLGKENFIFDKKQFLNEWKKLNLTGKDLFLYDASGNSDYLIYKAPTKIKAKPLNIPGAPGIFKSLNFNGSEKLIKQPLFSSSKIFFLAEIILIIFLLITKIAYKKNDYFATEDDLENKKRSFMAVGLSLIGTFISIFILNLLILYFYRPDTSAIIAQAAKIYLDSTLGAFLPKPVERLQFVFSILSSPLLILMFYKVAIKKMASLANATINRLYYILSIIFPFFFFSAAYIGLAVSNFLYIQTSYSFNNGGKYFYGLLLFPLLSWVIIKFKGKKYDKILNIFIYAFSALLILIPTLIIVINLNSPKLINDLSITFHLDPIIYPMSQIMAGKTMLVNLTSLYGLWPIFLEWIFKIFNFNILSFTFLMGIILGLSYFFIFLFLNRIIENKIFLLLGFSTIIFYFLENGGNPSPYFQYSPIRIFFPALALLLVSFYAENKNKFLYFALNIISSLSILWNLDSGIIIFAAWLATLFFIELFSKDKKTALKKILFHLVFSLLILFSVFLTYAGYTFLRSGSWPALSLLWQYQKMFFSGYFMIPMPFPHVWVLAAAVFLVGLAFSIKNMLDKNYSRKNISLFFLTILGLGLFTYYEGRSHDLVFYGPIYAALALLTVLLDWTFSSFRSDQRLFGNGLLLLTGLFFLISSPINLLYHSGKYYNWMKSGISSFNNAPPSETMLAKNVKFIKENTREYEKIVILSKNYYDGIFYAQSKTRSAVDLPASTDVFFKSEIEYLTSYLKCNNDYKLFIYPDTDYYFYDAKINEIIKNNYKIAKISDSQMALLIKKERAEKCPTP